MQYDKVVESYLRYLESIDRSDETINGYKKELKYLGDFLYERYSGEIQVKDISILDLEDYMYHIKKMGKKPATRSRVVYILRSFYNYLYRRELCRKNIAIFLETVKVKQTERTYISEKDMIFLSDNIDMPIIKVAVQTMFYTGLRVSEAVNLEIGDVKLDLGIINVIGGKGNKDRIIPINVKLHNVLTDYINHIRPEVSSNKFFCTKRTGKVSPQYINVCLHKAAAYLNWEDTISAHILRHSFASNLVLHNVPLPAVQKLLGHSDLRVTSRYIHQDLKQLEDAVNVL